MEQQVSSAWVPAVRALGRGAALLINHMVPEDEVRHGHGPSSQLSRAVREHLGDRRVVELYLAPLALVVKVILTPPCVFH